MERTARRYRRILVAILLVGATMGLTGCNKDEETAALRSEVDALKAYTVANVKWEDSLYKLYSHVYYCETGLNPKDCGPLSNHIAPPPPPPKWPAPLKVDSVGS